MVVGCVTAATTVATGNASTGGRQSAGSLHRTALLLKGHSAQGLWCWVMDMMEKVVSIAVAVLRATGLLRRR